MFVVLVGSHQMPVYNLAFVASLTDDSGFGNILSGSLHHTANDLSAGAGKVVRCEMVGLGV